ncbi:hypothetical protein chiPu_0026404, partial [Chiloscyllium punctatum]|nr:hypothetical protein [Chiloscyllium punctatum]
TYSLVLEVQDLEKKFLQVSEEERPAVLEHRKAKIALMYENLRGKQPPSSDRVSDDHFVQVMCIRKGKRLAAKVLLFLSTEQAANVVLATARNLPYLVKKDSQDEVLPCLTEACSILVSRLPSSALTELLQQLTGSTPSGQPGNHFPTILQNKVPAPGKGFGGAVPGGCGAAWVYLALIGKGLGEGGGRGKQA